MVIITEGGHFLCFYVYFPHLLNHTLPGHEHACAFLWSASPLEAPCVYVAVEYSGSAAIIRTPLDVQDGPHVLHVDPDVARARARDHAHSRDHAYDRARARAHARDRARVRARLYAVPLRLSRGSAFPSRCPSRRAPWVWGSQCHSPW